MKAIPIWNHINKSNVPRTIFKSIAQNFIGHEVSIFCKHCKQRISSVIGESGIVHCPICGNIPTAKNISLSISERRKLVTELCSNGGDLDQYIIGLMERFCLGLDDIETGELSRAGATNFYDYYRNEFAALDDCALYYLKSPDSPDSSVFSNSELDRMNYREDRKINCVHYGAFKSQADDEGESLADFVEAMAHKYQESNFTQYYDTNFSIKEFTEGLTNKVEKQIVYLLYYGYRKTEIQQIIGVTEAQLRTIISHIADHLKTPLVKDGRVKVCSCCHQTKIASDFGKDGRNKTDGLQSKCKACDAIRKKEKMSQDIQRKSA